eukprot:15563604-Heterocapsa_arctica.AAC.1
MIKTLKNNKTMIKATPKGGFGAQKRKNDGEGQDGPARQKQDQGLKWGDGGKSDGKGQMYGRPSAGAPAKVGSVDPGPPPFPQQPAQGSAMTWYVGQWIPMGLKDGIV